LHRCFQQQGQTSGRYHPEGWEQQLPLGSTQTAVRTALPATLRRTVSLGVLAAFDLWSTATGRTRCKGGDHNSGFIQLHTEAQHVGQPQRSRPGGPTRFAMPTEYGLASCPHIAAPAYTIEMLPGYDFTTRSTWRAARANDALKLASSAVGVWAAWAPLISLRNPRGRRQMRLATPGNQCRQSKT